MKTITTITTKANLIEELEAKADFYKKQAEELKDEIKAELEANGIDTYECEDGKVIRWTAYTASRFDTARFKKDFLAMYKEYTKEVLQKKWTISH